MRVLAVAATLLAVTVAGADDAAAPAVDRSKPDAVVQAYLAACERGDPATATALLKPDESVSAMLRQLGREGDLMGIVRDILLFPLSRLATSTGGPAQAAGDRTTVQVTRTLAAQQTLVLVKADDGLWVIDLRASLKASAPGGKSPLLAQIEMLDSLPRERAPQGEIDQTAWQCQNKVRELSSALQAFAEEHGGKLPSAAVWMDELEPYLDGKQPFSCPGHDKEESSYAFNQELDGATMPQDWQQKHWLTLLACVDGGVPNATFKPADLKTLKPRHGEVNVVSDGDGNARFLPAGMSPDDIHRVCDETSHCQERMRAFLDAAKKFGAEHGDKLPGATTWCDDLRPYLANFRPADGGDPFVCPSAPGAKCTYAINADLAG
ncbi:MAG: hypothetical protein HYU66_20385, partial [Armatimonadetes bacterium]|nr:hypothetical protein [Armatimonadota bacterium]